MLTQTTFKLFETVNGLGKPTGTPISQPLSDLTGKETLMGGVFYHCIAVSNTSPSNITVIAHLTNTQTADFNRMGFGKAITTQSNTQAPSGVTFFRGTSQTTMLPGETIQLWFERTVSPHTGQREIALCDFTIEAFV